MLFETEKIATFHNFLKQDTFNRYESWKHCYEAFGDATKENDYLALHLGFYLASWGMYRGSTGLLQKDYKIHIGAVTIIKKYYKDLRCSQNFEVSQESITRILELKKELYDYYNKFDYQTKRNTFDKKPPTDTLLSKIVLGTVGCSPAFDRYFNDGVKSYKIKSTRFEKKDFDELFKFIDRNRIEIIQFQNELFQKEDIYYPIFKLVDMFFWNEGFSIKK
jgi:hypothetical protein